MLKWMYNQGPAVHSPGLGHVGAARPALGSVGAPPRPFPLVQHPLTRRIAPAPRQSAPDRSSTGQSGGRGLSPVVNAVIIHEIDRIKFVFEPSRGGKFPFANNGPDGRDTPDGRSDDDNGDDRSFRETGGTIVGSIGGGSGRSGGYGGGGVVRW